MIRKTLGPLPFVLFLILFGLATPALAQSWTSANGKFTIDAEFVQVKEDKVQLKKNSDGKLIWVDLKKLNPEARKQAKRFQKEAGEQTSDSKKLSQSPEEAGQRLIETSQTQVFG